MRKAILVFALVALTIGICHGYYPPFYNNYQPKPYYNRNYVQQRQVNNYRRPQYYRRPYYPRYRYDDDDDRFDNDHDDWDDHNGYDSD